MRPVTTFRDQLAAATTAVEAAGVASPRVDAEWVLAGLLGVGRVTVRLDPAGAVPELLAERYGDAVRRRARREPLQRILGWEEFRGLRLRLTDAVLVPRPETEALVEWALALLPVPGGRRLLALDLGTGSGCISCALAAERSDLDVVAIDVSPAAAAVALDNARALGLASGSRPRRSGRRRAVRRRERLMPARLEIDGGVPLQGSVGVSAAKNAALPALAATLLTADRIQLTNVPDLDDVRTMVRLIERLRAAGPGAARAPPPPVGRGPHHPAPHAPASATRAPLLLPRPP